MLSRNLRTAVPFFSFAIEILVSFHSISSPPSSPQTFSDQDTCHTAHHSEILFPDDNELQKGDVITKINDVSVSTQESLSERANSYKKGTEVTITYQRNSNGTYKENTVKVKLAGKDALNGLSDSGSNSSSQGGQSGNSDQYGGQDGQEGQDGSNGSGGFGDFWGSLFGY